MTTDAIRQFRDDHYFLSMFYPHPLIYNGITWPDGEHAFQYAKIACATPVNEKALNAIRFAPTALAARRLGRSFPYVAASWEPQKLSVMTAINRAKFADPTLRNLLLATGTKLLEEGNRWHDTFWGICPPSSGIGENHLGRILMSLRDEFFAEAIASGSH